jgi:hypothetical protein
MSSWLPCERPGRFEEANDLDLMSITFCWFACAPCHDAAVELRRRQAVRPETHKVFPQAWSVITRVIERTAPTNDPVAQLAAQSRRQAAAVEAEVRAHVDNCVTVGCEICARLGVRQ